MGIYRDGWTDHTGRIFLLTLVNNPRHGRKFGWYLATADLGTFLEDFSLPLTEPEIIAGRRAGEHARHLGFRPTKVRAD